MDQEQTFDGKLPDLIGRDDEIGLIDGLIGRLEESGSALVLSGEVGIGKSALLRWARASAAGAGARTLSAIGVESESDLAFAGLHQLLGPILGLADRLPEPRRRALEAAFGMIEERVPDRFHVALAAQQLIVEASLSRPQVLLIDDAQWLDGSSLGVLTFIARRIDVDSIALLITLRDGYTISLEDEQLPRLRLERLRVAEAVELLDRTTPGIHPIRRAALLAEAAGNPLALVELAKIEVWPPPDAEAPGPGPSGLTNRLERAFAARLDGVPAETRLALLAAALDGRATLSEVVGAAAEIVGEPVELSALDSAVAAGLVEVEGGSVRFRHPLIRSSVRLGAPPGEVLGMYAALARTVADPERRLWHLAMGSVRPDEEIAAALVALATRAYDRGALSAAAAALERAVTLSADPRGKGERLLKGAEVAYELGLPGKASRMAAEAEHSELGPVEAAHLVWLRQMISGDVWRQEGAAKVFVTIAETIAAEGDTEGALRSLVPIAHRCWWTKTQARTRGYVVGAARGIGLAADDPRLLAVVGLADPEGSGPAVREEIARRRVGEAIDPRDSMHLGVAAEKVGDMALADAFLSQAVVGLREQGRIGLLAQALVHQAWVAVHTGHWDMAIQDGREGGMLSFETGQSEFGLTGELVAALGAAHRGEDIEELIARPERDLRGAEAGPMLAPVHLARGALAVGEGRLDDAVRHLLPVFDPETPVFHRFMRWSAVLDLAEAGAGGGQAARVQEVFDELETVAEETGAPYLRAGLDCARPLLADDTEAEGLFREAIERTAAGFPFMRGRAYFAYGRWLRRGRRNADSREPLRGAIEAFTALGAKSWEDRARQELRATGERLGPRTVATRDQLTAQEVQVGSLAAQGLSNREIGERLFLSHRTIGSHLYRIYPKLGITSRAQLRDALAGFTDTKA